ncbi:hypothetical protein, partial [Serratia fonticola]
RHEIQQLVVAETLSTLQGIQPPWDSPGQAAAAFVPWGGKVPSGRAYIQQRHLGMRLVVQALSLQVVVVL